MSILLLYMMPIDLYIIILYPDILLNYLNSMLAQLFLQDPPSVLGKLDSHMQKNEIRTFPNTRHKNKVKMD